MTAAERALMDDLLSGLDASAFDESPVKSQKSQRAGGYTSPLKARSRNVPTTKLGTETVSVVKLELPDTAIGQAEVLEPKVNPPPVDDMAKALQELDNLCDFDFDLGDLSAFDDDLGDAPPAKVGLNSPSSVI
jgi:hypothetical protein